MTPVTFFHGTTIESGRRIARDGFKPKRWHNGLSYIWMTLSEHQAQEYGKTVAELRTGDGSEFAVVEFHCPIEHTEPDPEHLDEDTEHEYASHRRTTHAIPRSSIKRVVVYRDGQPLGEMKEDPDKAPPTYN